MRMMRMLMLMPRSNICLFHGCLNIRFTPLASNLDAPPMIPTMVMMMMMMSRRRRRRRITTMSGIIYPNNWNETNGCEFGKHWIEKNIIMKIWSVWRCCEWKFRLFQIIWLPSFPSLNRPHSLTPILRQSIRLFIRLSSNFILTHTSYLSQAPQAVRV